MPGGVVKKYVRGVYGHFLLFGRFIRRKPDGQRRSKGRVLQTHCLTSPANSHVMETGTVPVQPSSNPEKKTFSLQSGSLEKYIANKNASSLLSFPVN